MLHNIVYMGCFYFHCNKKMCFYNIQTITLTYIYKKERKNGDVEWGERKEEKHVRKALTRSISVNAIRDNKNKIISLTKRKKVNQLHDELSFFSEFL